MYFIIMKNIYSYKNNKKINVINEPKKFDILTKNKESYLYFRNNENKCFNINMNSLVDFIVDGVVETIKNDTTANIGFVKNLITSIPELTTRVEDNDVNEEDEKKDNESSSCSDTGSCSGSCSCSCSCSDSCSDACSESDKESDNGSVKKSDKEKKVEKKNEETNSATIISEIVKSDMDTLDKIKKLLSFEEGRNYIYNNSEYKCANLFEKIENALKSPFLSKMLKNAIEKRGWQNTV